MKKYIVCLVLYLFLFSCMNFPKVSLSSNIVVNSYYSKLYFMGNDESYFKDSEIFNIKNKSDSFLKFNKPHELYMCKGECNNKKDEIIKFYQDPEHKCYLFAYTSKEINDLEYTKRNIQDKADKKNKSDYTPYKVFILFNKNGAEAITEMQYNQLKPTLKPHPYDPSLCKPEPTYEELYKIKGIK